MNLPVLTSWEMDAGETVMYSYGYCVSKEIYGL